MRKKIVLVFVMFLAWGASSAWSQNGVSARATANVDLTARLKEAQANPKLQEQLYKTGKSVASFCANCHGEGGNSTKPDIPNLAGQNPVYLLEQIKKFASGQRRFEFMEGMIKALNADEKVGMVLFYADQKVSHNTAKPNPAEFEAGRKIYQSTCFACHAADGHGNETFARIAGQQTNYLSATLKQYRSGTGNRINPLMSANTKALSDKDIDALVAFVSRME